MTEPKLSAAARRAVIDAADGICHGGAAVLQDFDPLDQLERYRVQVDKGARAVIG